MWNPHHEWYPLPLFGRERYVGGEEVGCQGQGVGQGGALEWEENFIEKKRKLKPTVSLLKKQQKKSSTISHRLKLRFSSDQTIFLPIYFSKFWSLPKKYFN